MVASRFARIAVTIDGSPNSQEALETVIDLAGKYGSELAILAIAPFVPVYLPSAGPYVAATVADGEVARYRELVDAAVQRAQRAGLAAVTGICREGVIVDEILSHLESHPTDLVVVGSRGLSEAKRLLIGSVSSALVAHAPCPVLVVRPSAPTKPVPG
jgi:nucleotide-binding universal stress UspA family protein